MIEIAEINIALGSIIEKNSTIENKFSLKKGTIYNLTGIKKRTIVNNIETAESLALKACENFKRLKFKKITHIISVTNTPTIRFPGISNYLSSKLNLSNVHCLNLNQGCTGFVDALEISYELIRNNKKAEVLLVTSDTYSKFINKNNKAVRCLFSDGAAATLIKYKKDGLKLKKKIFKNIINTETDLSFTQNEINMNGPAVVSFAMRDVIPDIVNLSKNIDCMFSHQAGKVVMSQIQKKINTKVFFPLNFENHGNLVSTSIPLLIKQNMKRFKTKKKILICGFGVGLSASMILFNR
jgi:3-oxoacyl-[acyl-carrier-protein] synthase III